jgi:hypothetical protein
MCNTFQSRILTSRLREGKKRKLDGAIDTDTANTNVHHDNPQQTSTFTAANEGDIDAFYEALSSCGTKPAILSLVPKYSSSYVPKCLLGAFPQPFTMLHKPAYMELEYHDLLKACESVKIEVTVEMAHAVEKETRLQSSSKLLQAAPGETLHLNHSHAYFTK